MGVILKSVGRAGVNAPQDVISVKALLNAYEPRPSTLKLLKLHEECDRHTVEAITEFQKEVLCASKPDGLVEPTRPMIQRLIYQAKLTGSVSYPFQATNQDAMVVQALLNRFLPPNQRITVDGMFGKESLAALQKVQKQMGMVNPTGKVGPGSKTLSFLKEGLNDPKAAPPGAKSKAWDLVCNFAARQGNGVFNGIKRQDVANNLYARIESPSKLDQGDSSLCGAMALFYFVARCLPEAYVSYVIDLYEKGEGKINNLSVKPGEQLKNATPPSAASVGPADWIAAASLRDSKNAKWPFTKKPIFPYSDPSKEFAGITLPIEIATWLQAVGAKDITYDTSPRRMNGEEGMMNLFTAGVASKDPKNWVILLIDAGVLNNKDPAVNQYHWVGLLSALVNRTSVALEVFTWGKKRTIPAATGAILSTSGFLEYYHGHIRCKAP